MDGSFAALTRVQQRVNDIRTRIADLVPLVRSAAPQELRGPLGVRSRMESVVSSDLSGQAEAMHGQSEAGPQIITAFESTIPDEISQMSENEAKAALTVCHLRIILLSRLHLLKYFAGTSRFSSSST